MQLHDWLISNWNWPIRSKDIETVNQAKSKHLGFHTNKLKIQSYDWLFLTLVIKIDQWKQSMFTANAYKLRIFYQNQTC